MLKVRFMSDLHSEFEDHNTQIKIPEHEEDKDTVLVLAGDVGLAKRPENYTNILSQVDRFRKVVMVMGNHEHYNGSIKRSYDKLTKLFEGYENLHLLENEYLIVDDVVFIGASLWTDFNSLDENCMRDSGNFMNDYHIIRTGPDGDEYQRKLVPEDTAMIHAHSRAYIFDAIKVHKELGRKVVVVTHNGPSKKSIHPKYKDESTNGAYTSDLEMEIGLTRPNVWIHGHTHDSFEYNVEETQVKVNPRGYVGHEVNPNFDVNRNFEV